MTLMATAMSHSALTICSGRMVRNALIFSSLQAITTVKDFMRNTTPLTLTG